MAVIIDGKAIAKKTREYLKKEVEELKENGINPKLSVIMVGDNAASKVYIKNKSKACDEVGVKYEEYILGAVILNRVKSSQFPNTIAGVIYQKGAFTAVSDGQINKPIAENSTVYKAARDAMNGWDPTGGCIYYFNPATATNKWIWSRPLVKTIGKHRFCK